MYEHALDDAKLIDGYIQLANDWGVAMQHGDSKVANNLHDQLNETFQKIAQKRKESDLFTQVDVVSDASCFWIASHLKTINRSKAMALYKRLSKSPLPFIAISSEYIVKEMYCE